ncbi:MAG: anthranilate synthase component I family protein [Pirellulales bacterium]|nr:anthranilate synthase component I family protein [Pirellulales bacterium]
MTLPRVIELNPPPDVAACLERFRTLPYCLLLDSARRHARLGRYSFLMADPLRVLHLESVNNLNGREANADLFAQAQRLGEQYPAKDEEPGVVPFTGGLAGFCSYDLNRALERLPAPRFDEFQLPLAVLGVYDVVLAWDHVAGRAWLISRGWPPEGGPGSAQRATDRLRQFQKILSAARAMPDVQSPAAANISDLTIADLCIAGPLPGYPMVWSNFSREQYTGAIEQAREYICAGDIFQVNLAQRLLTPVREPAWQMYARLRMANPATFGGYFDFGAGQILSASPERFLRVRRGKVEARPIKGTRPRSPWPEADLFAGDELLASEKDRAENVMIVDLLRNDLSRVCTAESVRVAELCRLELYEYVQHLVSVINGELAPGQSAWDLLRAAWPGGSITGAPKVRAMEIITELECVARGPYCGALLYAGANGDIDANLLIRTLIVSRGWAQFPVGGGITTASDPATEYTETWHKAAGLLRALEFNAQ